MRCKMTRAVMSRCQMVPHLLIADKKFLVNQWNEIIKFLTVGSVSRNCYEGATRIQHHAMKPEMRYCTRITVPELCYRHSTNRCDWEPSWASSLDNKRSPQTRILIIFYTIGRYSITEPDSCFLFFFSTAEKMPRSIGIPRISFMQLSAAYP